MRQYLLLALFAVAAADKPAVPPAYQAPAPKAPAAAPDSYGSPAAPAASAQDSYGSPQAPPQTDTYGSPAAPVVDEYGSPSAAVSNSYAAPAPAAQAEQAPVGNQGYYYYYYPVRQNAPANNDDDDGGLLGNLGSLLGAALGKKILVIALIITGLLVLTALGVNVGFGRSFGARSLTDMYYDISDLAEPYMTQENMMVLANYVQNAINREY